jgi:hypothetical protein
MRHPQTSAFILGLAAAAAAVLLAGCATGTAGLRGSAVAGPETPPAVAPVLPPAQFELPKALPVLARPEEVVEPLPGGGVDWADQTVRARGSGVVDPGASNPAQARLMAERAAVVVAQRNLLEIVKGVRVDSDTRVENFMTDYDVIYTRVEGYVKGARQRGPARFDESAGLVEVELEMSLHGPQGVSDALAPAIGAAGSGPAASAVPPNVIEFFRQYSGLAFDGGAAGLKPSLYPKIYDENGNLLLDTRDYAGFLGQGGPATLQFVQDLDRVLARPEFARQPLVLKVRQVTGRLGTDLILGAGDADKLKWLKEGFKYVAGIGRFLLKVLL